MTRPIEALAYAKHNAVGAYVSQAPRPPSGRALFLALFAMVASALVALAAQAYVPPAIQDHVTDLAGKLTPSERNDLDTRLEEVNRTSGAEIAVLIVSTLGNDSIEDVAYGTFNTWKLGKKGADNGVLLVIAVAEHRVRIETGKGVEGELTDLQTQDIIQHQIGPALKDGRFYDGIRAGTDAIAAAVGGRAPNPVTAVARPMRWSDVAPIGFLLFFSFVWIALAIRSIIRRRSGG
jgi:uncharacterized protein